MGKERCQHINHIMVEEFWDYDWILYRRCNDCWLMINTHTWIEFDQILKKEEYGLAYQFQSGRLVWYSCYRAEWLNNTDNLKAIENQLWGEVRNLERVFIPLRNLSYPHILNIIKDYNEWRMNIKPSYMKYFNSIKVIEWKNYPVDIQNELQELAT